MKFSLFRHLIASPGRSAGFPLHDPIEFVEISARSERRKIIQGANSGDLLGYGRGDELVEARTVLSCDFLRLRLYRSRQTEGVGRHRGLHTPSFASACLGVHSSTPK